MDFLAPSEKPATENVAIGAPIANSIEAYLGLKLEFPDANGDIARLRDGLSSLQDAVIEPEQFAHDAHAAYWRIYDGVVRGHLQAHRASLAAGSVLVEDEDGSLTRKRVSLAQKDTFAENIDEVEEHHAASEAEGDTGVISQEALEGMKQLLLHEGYTRARELSNAIPQPEPKIFGDKPSISDRVMFKLYRVQMKPYEPYPAEVLAENPIDTKHISRKARKLLEWIDCAIDNPAKETIAMVMDAARAEIEIEAVEEIDRKVAARNARSFNRLRPEVKQRPERVEDELPEETKPSNTTSTETTQPENTPERRVAIEQIEGVRVHLPWIDEAEEQTIAKVTYAGDEVYVATGFDHRLAAISATVRDKMTDSFNAAIQHHAKRIAAGIMPYQNTNNVKRLRFFNGKQNDQALPLGDIPVWYTFDMSPNAPRVYFTLKKMSEILEGTVSSRVDPDKLCMIVLAETDKANQVDTLSILTGASHRSLRSGGVGSI